MSSKTIAAGIIASIGLYAGIMAYTASRAATQEASGTRTICERVSRKRPQQLREMVYEEVHGHYMQKAIDTRLVEYRKGKRTIPELMSYLNAEHHPKYQSREAQIINALMDTPTNDALTTAIDILHTKKYNKDIRRVIASRLNADHAKRQIHQNELMKISQAIDVENPQERTIAIPLISLLARAQYAPVFPKLWQAAHVPNESMLRDHALKNLRYFPSRPVLDTLLDETVRLVKQGNIDGMKFADYVFEVRTAIHANSQYPCAQLPQPRDVPYRMVQHGYHKLLAEHGCAFDELPRHPNRWSIFP